MVFGVAYGLLAITSKKKLAANSALVAETSRHQMKALHILAEGIAAGARASELAKLMGVGFEPHPFSRTVFRELLLH